MSIIITSAVSSSAVSFPQGVLYYWCKFGVLGNSSTASGSIDPRGDGRRRWPELQLGFCIFFLICCLLHIQHSLVTFFLCFLVLFVLAVPMHKCLGKPSCMSSTFPVPTLNGICFFRYVKATKNLKQLIEQVKLIILNNSLQSATVSLGCVQCIALRHQRHVARSMSISSLPPRSSVCENHVSGVT